ncbi:hypothetical protein [Psychromonas aquimarina]|uniref:hypothetical protein n=1 Tax=Psychromonas aquimarina TaxID=444919 RepID=UPI00041B2F52|nr:hypothetical protein [Psychromonas aquimarina]
MGDNIKQLLARSRTVLKGASLELQLRNPYARKLGQVNNMLHWLDCCDTSLSYCEREYQNVAKYVLNATNKPVQIIEYRSCAEGIEHPTFIIVNKSDYANELEAFITLYSHQLEHSEEWYLKDINPDNIEAYLDNTLYPYLREFEYKLLDESNVLADTAWYSEQALDRILNSRKEFESSDYRSGLYENGQRLEVDDDYLFPVEGRFCQGLSLRSDWNDVEMFYETTQEYVLFVWWTGA